MPSALASRISSMFGKVYSMCCVDQSTTTPSYELSEDTSAVDRMESEDSLLDKVDSDRDEIQKILTGGEADGWYS